MSKCSTAYTICPPPQKGPRMLNPGKGLSVSFQQPSNISFTAAETAVIRSWNMILSEEGHGTWSYQKTSVSSSSVLQKNKIYEHSQVNDLHYCNSEKIKGVWTDKKCYSKTQGAHVKHC